MKQENALLIFIKNPELGKAKTRLAATVGDERALAIYKELLRHTRHIAEATEATRLLFYSKFINDEDDWQGRHFQKHLQADGDLGKKMQTAFELALGQHQKAVIIGSDCASLNAEIVAQAFQKLEEVPFVIGPATDGGYYLLGMHQFTPSLFENIPWSTSQVLPKTIQKIAALQQDYFLLPTLSDIDYETDWNQHGWHF
ncbi:MAG: TIGR04282 family arsenosugar biosynthesis glycosyltransferase [Bacteroidota bacterium]